MTSKTSKQTKPDAGHKDNWRKFYGKVEAHQRSSPHVLCYITWKELEKTVLKTTGIDEQLQWQFKSEVSKWREIFRCILDVVLFLSERQLPFRGSTTELKNNSRMQAHYLSPRSQNEFIDECSKVVLNGIVEEVKQALHYIASLLTVPRTFPTQNK